MSSVRNSHFSFKPPTPTTFLAREIVELEKSKLDGRSAHFGVPYRFYVGTKTEFFDFIEQNRIFDSLGEDLGFSPPFQFFKDSCLGRALPNWHEAESHTKPHKATQSHTKPPQSHTKAIPKPYQSQGIGRGSLVLQVVSPLGVLDLRTSLDTFQAVRRWKGDSAPTPSFMTISGSALRTLLARMGRHWQRLLVYLASRGGYS
jgi:hypothetical protein